MKHMKMIKEVHGKSITHKLAKTFKSERQISISSETIDKYIGYSENAFIIKKAVRYDVKGRKYIVTPVKYYYSDLGLRNARLEFRQLEVDFAVNKGDKTVVLDIIRIIR